jgi:YidC/Oxa1 family membrane protein insertase
MTKKLTIAIFVLVVLALSASGALAESKAQELLASAAAYTVKADKATSSSERDEYYNKALKDYQQIQKNKAFSGTPEAAEGLMMTALLYRNAKGKMHNLYQSYDSLKRLITAFDKPRSVLEETLTDSEVRRVQEQVSKAKELKKELMAAMNKENSTKPLYKVMDFLVGLTGRVPWLSYWLALVILAVGVKVLITPLTKAQYKSMAEMQRVAPLIKEIQAKYKGDQKAIGEKTMALYKEHKINPLAGCLPLLIQMPILIGVYHTIKVYEFQLEKGTFLWIGSAISHIWHASVPMNPSQTVYLAARNLSEGDVILLLLYLVSMYISMKLSNVDPSQAEQQKMMAIMMPIMMGLLFAGFPSGFILYWLVFNILQTTQQYFIIHGAKPAPALVPAVEELPADAEEPPTVPRVRRRKK